MTDANGTSNGFTESRAILPAFPDSVWDHVRIELLEPADDTEMRRPLRMRAKLPLRVIATMNGWSPADRVTFDIASLLCAHVLVGLRLNTSPCRLWPAVRRLEVNGGRAVAKLSDGTQYVLDIEVCDRDDSSEPFVQASEMASDRGPLGSLAATPDRVPSESCIEPSTSAALGQAEAIAAPDGVSVARYFGLKLDLPEHDGDSLLEQVSNYDALAVGVDEAHILPPGYYNIIDERGVLENDEDDGPGLAELLLQPACAECVDAARALTLGQLIKDYQTASGRGERHGSADSCK